MNKPLIEVLDSSILAEYGNCDRLMEILEKLALDELRIEKLIKTTFFLLVN